MKIDKSLEEVWKWKDAVYEETKNMTVEERNAYSRKNVEELPSRRMLCRRTPPQCH